MKRETCEDLTKQNVPASGMNPTWDTITKGQQIRVEKAIKLVEAAFPALCDVGARITLKDICVKYFTGVGNKLVITRKGTLSMVIALFAYMGITVNVKSLGGGVHTVAFK